MKQTQYTPTHKDPSFHSPPRRKGLYAFPKGYVELFLLGSTSYPSHISGKSKWIKFNNQVIKGTYDELVVGYANFQDIFNNNIISKLKQLHIKIKDVHLDKIDNINGEVIYALSIINKPKHFAYTGDIWHHLINETERCFINETHGSWIKTDYNTYLDAFNTMLHKHHIYTAHENNIKTTNRLLINKGVYSTSLDHLEVFIERI